MMLYVSKTIGSKVYITDTDDNVTEELTAAQARALPVSVAGVYPDGITTVMLPADVKEHFLSGEFKESITHFPYYFKFTMTFLPKRKNENKEYFYIQRLSRKSFNFYDYTCGRILKLDIDEVYDRIKYYFKTMDLSGDITVSV